MRHLTAAAAVAVAVAVLLGGSAAADEGSPPPVPPGLGIRLLDAPGTARDDPRAAAYVVDHLRPGASITRHVLVTNGTAGSVDVDLYAGAARVTAGGFEVLEGRARNDLTGWTTVSPATATLPPGGSTRVTVTVAVPATATGGERYAAILAQTRPAAAASGNVAVSSRVGVRVYLSVGGAAEPVSAFTVSTLTAVRATDGTPAVLARVTNTGQRALDLTGSLALDGGPGGLAAGPFPVAALRTLGIGDTGEMGVPVDRTVPPGPWHAVMTVRSGTLEQRVEATLSFPAAPGGSAAPVAARRVPLTRDRSVVAPLAAALLLAVAALLGLVWWRARRASRPAVSRSGR